MLLFLIAFPLAGQQAPVLHTAVPPPGNTTGNTVLTAPVVIRDKKGAPVLGLTKDDFVLQVEGRPQAISSLAPASGLPLTLGLVVDTNPSQKDNLDSVRTASQSFVDGLTGSAAGGAPVTVFVMQFGRQVELLEDPTASHTKLQAAVDDLGTAGSSTGSTGAAEDDSGSSTDKKSAPKSSGGVLYDAAFLASDDVLTKRPGRRVLVVVTDGSEHGSRETEDAALEAAQRANAVIYAVYLKGEEPRQPANQRNYGNPRAGGGYPGGGYPGGGYPGGGYPGGGYPGGGYPGGGYPGGGYPGGGGGQGPGNSGPQRTPTVHADGRKTLERWARDTGGQVLEVSRKQPLSQVYSQIADDLRAQYILSFTPDAPLSSGYHQIDLAPKGGDDKKLFVQTRDGFYGGK